MHGVELEIAILQDLALPGGAGAVLVLYVCSADVAVARPLVAHPLSPTRDIGLPFLPLINVLQIRPLLIFSLLLLSRQPTEQSEAASRDPAPMEEEDQGQQEARPLYCSGSSRGSRGRAAS